MWDEGAFLGDPKDKSELVSRNSNQGQWAKRSWLLSGTKWISFTIKQRIGQRSHKKVVYIGNKAHLWKCFYEVAIWFISTTRWKCDIKRSKRKVAMKQFKSVLLSMIPPFRSTRRLWQRYRRVICLQCKEYGSTLRQWSCNPPTRATLNGSQFIQPNWKDTLCGRMEGPFGR